MIRLRLWPAVQAVKECLDAGKLGEPGLLRVHRWQPNDGPPKQLLDEIDLACWLFGTSPQTIYATGHPGQALERDYVQMHFGFQGGGMALIDRAWTLPPGNHYFSLSLIGSTGAAYADDHHNMQLLFKTGGPAALNPMQGDHQVHGRVEENPLLPPENAWVPLIAEAVTRSLATGNALRWAGAQYEIVES